MEVKRNSGGGVGLETDARASINKRRRLLGRRSAIGPLKIGLVTPAKGQSSYRALAIGEGALPTRFLIRRLIPFLVVVFSFLSCRSTHRLLFGPIILVI